MPLMNIFLIDVSSFIKSAAQIVRLWLTLGHPPHYLVDLNLTKLQPNYATCTTVSTYK